MAGKPIAIFFPASYGSRLGGRDDGLGGRDDGLGGRDDGLGAGMTGSGDDRVWSLWVFFIIAFSFVVPHIC